MEERANRKLRTGARTRSPAGGSRPGPAGWCNTHSMSGRSATSRIPKPKYQSGAIPR